MISCFIIYISCIIMITHSHSLQQMKWHICSNQVYAARIHWQCGRACMHACMAPYGYCMRACGVKIAVQENLTAAWLLCIND